jgi:YVTN family beta-propeller protein
MTSGTALAERPTDWLAALSTPRVPVASAALPAVRAPGHVQRISRPGVVGGLIGAVTDLAVTRDGRQLVAAHYGDDAVSVIDTDTLAVTATVSGIAEPYAVVAAEHEGVAVVHLERHALDRVRNGFAGPRATGCNRNPERA